MQEETLTAKEQRKQYEKLKAELLSDYKAHKVELDYAADDVEEGLVREKREKLARQIKALSAKIAEIEKSGEKQA